MAVIVTEPNTSPSLSTTQAFTVNVTSSPTTARSMRDF